MIAPRAGPHRQQARYVELGERLHGRMAQALHVASFPSQLALISYTSGPYTAAPGITQGAGRHP
jgi:hypothetical protein